MRKKIVALLLVLLICAALPIAARGERNAIRLLEIYGSDMLFQQGQPIRLAGFAPQGTALHAELYLGGTPLAQVDGTAAANGMFELALPPQAASYTEYRIEVSAGGSAVASLERVVFGELWLAGGQSNMDWQLSLTPDGFGANKAGTVPAKPWVRLLYTPVFPEYQGDPNRLPLLPQEDIKGAAWWRGDTVKPYSFSAVAWHFACELQAALDVPVGVVGASLGGSSIYSWLARGEIESNTQIRKDVETLWRYLPSAGWDTHPDPTHYHDMTVNYNKRIYPLRHFSPSGLIWYQGETDVYAYMGRSVPWDSGNAYKRALTLLQESWADLFGVSDLPLVCTNLAAYIYNEHQPEQPGLFNAMLGELDAASDTLATVAIYDVPLDWDIATDLDPSLGQNDPIHPYIKRPVGERMALAAQGMCYGADYATPVPQTAQVSGGAVVITFAQTGDGLIAKSVGGGTRLRGFTVAGADGYFHEAKAEIVGTNQLRVWNDDITEPVGAAYAVGNFSLNANLSASFGGKTIAAAPFVTKQISGAVYPRDGDWRSCDFEKLWEKIETVRFVPSFKPIGNAKVSFLESGKEGGALRITSEKGGLVSFGATPVNAQGNYSREKAVTFYVRNPGAQSVKLTGLRFYTSWYTWYSMKVDIEIPANSDWQKVTVDFSELYLYGKAFAPLLPGNSTLLKNVIRLELRFNASGAAQVELDEFTFTPRQAQETFGYGVGQIFLALLHPLRTIWALFMTLV